MEILEPSVQLPFERMTASSRAGWYTALCLVLLTGGIVSVLAGSIGTGIVMIALAAVPLIVARASGPAPDATGAEPSVNGEEPLMSVEEVAQMLDTSSGSILMLVARDSIPYVEAAPGAPRGEFRFRRADIDEWLRSDPYYVPSPGE
jgi:excisionase family DNA binding protein